jgi:5-(carboxyamino)imidazole ribonucleotide synthase
MSSEARGVPVVGMAGGGQLARMTQQAAIPLAVELRVLTGSAGDSAARVIPGSTIGDERDAADLSAFAAECDVLTFDHEHVPQPVLRELEHSGHTVRPSAAALEHAQDKAHMRQALGAAGLPCPDFAVVSDAEEARRFAVRLGADTVVLKAITGGYDGKGVWLCPVDELVSCEAFAAGRPVLAEELVRFERELAAVVVRRPSGDVVAYPVVESVQAEGICVEVLAPAPGLPTAVAQAARDVAVGVAELLDVVGVLAVELFATADGAVVVNELAMRPHNTGHWTIEGAVTSQFENHLRAVLDLPLGAPDLVAGPTVMANLLGSDAPALHANLASVLGRDPGVHVHLYGKQVRPGRKIGHVTVVGEPGSDVDGLRHRASAAVRGLRGEGGDDT